MGKKVFDCDREEFENLCKQHSTVTDIANHFGVSEDTIQRWCKRTYGKTFKEVYRRFQATGRISLRRWLWAAAERGNVPALIFLSKNELGMSDKNPDTSYDAALNKLDQILNGIGKQANEIVVVEDEEKKKT